MPRKSLPRPRPTDENVPPPSYQLPTPASTQEPSQTLFPSKMKSVNKIPLSARRCSPRLSAAREAMLVQEGLEGESGREGVRVEIQAPTSEGSEREAGAVRESRIPVRRRGEGAGTSSQSLLLPTSQPISTLRSRSNSAKPRPSASPRLPSINTSKSKSTPPTKSRRKSAGKLLATPNTTFDEAPSTPDSEGDDPLLLKGVQRMRGWGEGKPRREGSWGGESGSGRSGRRSMSGRRSLSARKASVPRENQVEKDLEGHAWADEALAPLGSGTLLSDHEQEQEEERVDPNAGWKDENYFFDYPPDDNGAASASASPQRSPPLPLLLPLFPLQNADADAEEEEVEEADETLEIDSAIHPRPPHNLRDYSVPVLFTSPDVATRKRPRRPSSPAPAKLRMVDSEPEDDLSMHREESEGRTISLLAVGMEETMEEGFVVLEEELSAGKDAFDSSSSTDSERRIAEEQRWDGPIMSEDSTNVPSLMNGNQDEDEEEAEEKEEEGEEEESRAVSAELLGDSRGTTPRKSPPVEIDYPPRSIGDASPDTQMIFSPFPPRRSISTGLEATRIVHFRESAPFDSLILSAPPPPPVPTRSLPSAPVAQAPAEYPQRRQSTILPTPQIIRHLVPQQKEDPTTRRGSRPRPSHPTLPVIEISSTDPRAAAEAVAFLKIRHGYVERGLEYPTVLVGSSQESAEGEWRRGSSRARKTEEEVERELRGLLVEAERSVSARLSVGAAEEMERSPTPNRLLPPSTRNSSVLADYGSSSQVPTPARSSISETRSWTAVDWRRLEQALIDERRVAKRERREVVAKDVITNFLNVSGSEGKGLDGDWSWAKLETRLSALRQRRARDSESRSRASSIVGTPNPSTLASEIGRATFSRFNFGAVLRDVVDYRRVGSAAKESVQEEMEEEEDDSSEGERNEEEDTFFERSRPSRLPSPERLPSAPPIALASLRHAHLLHVEKPPLPVESWSGGFRVKMEEMDEDEMERLRSPEKDVDAEMERLRSPEKDVDEEMQEVPSSARRLVSYLGSFVRRSAAPELSSPARRHEEAASSSEERERIDDTISLALLRSNLRPVLPTPQKRHPLSNMTTQRPSFPPSQALTRRRSSGENSRVQDSIDAIESAESSFEDGVVPFDLLASASGSLGSGFLRKRLASETDLRGMSARKGGGGMDSPSMIPSGTRALDRQFELSKGMGRV